jgi:hypothetical protein
MGPCDSGSSRPHQLSQQQQQPLSLLGAASAAMYTIHEQNHANGDAHGYKMQDTRLEQAFKAGAAAHQSHCCGRSPSFAPSCGLGPVLRFGQ